MNSALRSPITITRGHLEIGGQDPAEWQEAREVILDELDRIARMVDGVIDYAPNVFVKFMTWLGTEHPGAIEEVYVERDGMSPTLEPDSLARLGAYIEKYNRSVNCQKARR